MTRLIMHTYANIYSSKTAHWFFKKYQSYSRYVQKHTNVFTSTAQGAVIWADTPKSAENV